MRRIFLSIVALFSLVAGAQAEGQAPEKIIFGYGPGSAWAAAWIAQDRGIFHKNGLEVEFSFVSGGQLQAATLIADAVNIVGNNPIQILLADESGADLVIVAGADGQTKENAYSGVAYNTKTIAKPSDYVGKKVAVPGLQSLMHIAFQMWLKTKGVDPKQVSFVETQMQNMPDQLATHQIDAAVSSPPFLDVLASKPDAKVLNFTAQLPQPDFVDAFYMAKREWTKAHPKALAAFRASIREATDMVVKNPEIVRPELVKYLKMKPEDAQKASLPNYFFDVTPPMMQFWIDAAHEFGVTRKTISVDDVLLK
jgi:NitT/TauT family transport system substrate-binding protein